ncbi:S8 family peptidase [Streptomyces specialis]|uniref:S8 family peptidase n=1 Tax=Streptomyces specialis TaxID=498367 RepID=UPI00073E7E74|nr:S8 family peptidase [Streptomyces specialis]
MATLPALGRTWIGRSAATAAVLALGFGVALPAAAHADEPRGVIAGTDAPDAIPGSYIVILEDSAFAASSAQGEALADRYDAEVGYLYEHALNGFSAEMSESDARALAADPAVRQVVQDGTVRMDATQPNPPGWGTDRIDQPYLPLDESYTSPDNGGDGVTAYILDTGVRYSHQDFGGRATFGFDAYGGNGSDLAGHGTHVAATVAGATYGVAKAADIVSVRVLNEDGYGTLATIIAGVDWVTGDADGPSVANMSLGYTGGNAAVDQAVRNSIASGVTYVVSAGNDRTDASGQSPARVQEAVTVGASDRIDTVWSFSNVGPVVDIFAPGDDITAAWHTGDTAQNTISGTSMAAPHVTGAAAIHLATHPTATPAQVEDALVDSAALNRLQSVPSDTANVLLHTGGQGGLPAQPTGPVFTQDTDVPVSDNVVSTSYQWVSGMSYLDGIFQVEVHIQHGAVGDLVVDLVAPDGTTMRLREYSGGLDDNLNHVYTFDGTGIQADSAWTLRVQDHGIGNQGFIDSWSLRF